MFSEAGFSIETYDKALRGQDLLDAASEAHVSGYIQPELYSLTPPPCFLVNLAENRYWGFALRLS